MVGVYHPGYNLTVDRSGSDRIDDWLYNEGFNRPNVSPSSLYEAQKQLREEISGIKINELSKRTHPDFVYQKDDKIVSETRSWEKYNSNLRYFREKGWTMYRQLI